MIELSQSPETELMGKSIDDAELTAVIAITPIGELQLVTQRYLASHATSATYLTMLDREIELAQRAESDTPEYSIFDESDLESLHALHDHMTSNPHSSVPLKLLDPVLAVMLGMLQDPACDSVHSDIKSALASIGAGASPALCEVITTAGPFKRKVLAINVLQTTYPYVPATTQGEIASAVETASRQATTSKKLTAAIAAAKAAIQTTPVAMTAQMESTAPHLAASLDATSAI